MTDLTRARALLDAGRPSEASRIALARLAAEPGDGAALGVLGEALLETGQAPSAVLTLERALALGEDSPRVRGAAALALEAAGEPATAERLLREDGVEANAIALSDLLVREGRAAEASELLAGVTDASALVRRADALVALDDLVVAREVHERALRLAPALARFHAATAERLRVLGMTAAASSLVKRGQVLRPSDGELRHLDLAYHGGQPAAADPGYVRATYDAFAETFDARLREELEYRVPEKLADLLAVGQGPAPEVLDLGCGTGAMGAVLAGGVAAIDGVDLSERMLDGARARGVYRRLVCDEILDALTKCGHTYDLVVAADVLIYLGDLTPFFAGVAGVLRPGGRLAFSLEAAADPVELRPNGRFGHNAGATAALLEASAFAVRASEETVVRLEVGEPVAGQLMVAERQGA